MLFNLLQHYIQDVATPPQGHGSNLQKVIVIIAISVAQTAI